MESVYVETTVISYLASRPSRDLIIAAHQQISEEWWSDRLHKFECYLSQTVLDEISAGDADASKKRLSFAQSLKILEIPDEADLLAETILSSGVLPPKAARDAIHIAVATANGIDYLLTWNCTHIANARILRRIEEICSHAGYTIPIICTPEELMGE